MTIITNNHKREIISYYDMPQEILESDFDWATEEESFVKYRGVYYALSEFMRISKPGNVNPWSPVIDSDLKAWHGIFTDSFFSAILIRIDDDDSDYVVMGLYLS